MARVMIVDDSGIVRKNMEIMLKKAGHEVVATADNGINAYMEYKRKLPDLVTMDLTMPDMDGIEAMQKIILDFPDAKIIVVSGLNERQSIIKAVRCGACHFLTKPIDQDKLMSVVDMVLVKGFDQNKRLELVQRLEVDAKGREKKQVPYVIEDKEGKYVVITINDTIQNNHMASLQTDIDNLLFKFQTKFIFDFGNGGMPFDLLPRLNALITIIKTEDGMVRAVSTNAQFVQQVKVDEISIISGLADVIRFLPK